MRDAEAAGSRILNPSSTAAVILGAYNWTEAGLGRAPSFLRSARHIVAYLYDPAGLGLNPELVLDLFDDPASAGDLLARVRDSLDVQLRERREAGHPVTDLLVYYIGHGHTDDQGHLSLLVRRSRQGLEAETGIKAPDLARTLRLAAPQQRRSVILDCCFSEAAARGFIGMGSDLNQQVAAIAAKDFKGDHPARGTLLLCSSPVGQVSIGAPEAARTLFTGAVLDVLREGDKERSSLLSFADLRDAAFERMVASFGADAPQPVLHQVNAALGDLTRAPAFLNRATVSHGAQGPSSASNFLNEASHRTGERNSEVKKSDERELLSPSPRLRRRAPLTKPVAAPIGPAFTSVESLFVSWAGADAKNIADHIRSLLVAETVRVHVSSPEIRTSQLWERDLSTLQSASEGLVIFCQDAIKSDWLIHESAILSSILSEENLTIFRLGTPAEMLPGPLRRFRHTELTRRSMERWLAEMDKKFALRVPSVAQTRFLDAIQSAVTNYVSTHVSAQEDKWAGTMTRPISISRQRESPFEVLELLRIAKRSLILVAPIHGFITLATGYSDIIEARLFETLASGVSVELIAMHPRARPIELGRGTPGLPDACTVWANYVHVAHFREQLETCWRTLSRWHERAEREFATSRLSIKGAFLLPLSMNFVDPDDENGFLVLSPRLDQQSAPPRPQFIITKRHEGMAFDFYWDTHRSSYDAAGWVDIQTLLAPPRRRPRASP